MAYDTPEAPSSKPVCRDFYYEVVNGVPTPRSATNRAEEPQENGSA